MYDLKSKNTDVALHCFINDYVEGKLDSVEHSVFEEYLSLNSQIASFTTKSKQGKRALRNAYCVQAADDFEEKLMERIAQEKHDSD